jgi:hypothetical protein
MARFLVLLDANADESDRDAAVDAIRANGGEIVAVFDPHIVVAEGDESAQDAAGEFLGISVLGTDTDGTIDPSGLGLPTELEAMVALWTQTFTPEVQTALANRFREGENWDFPGPCTVG